MSTEVQAISKPFIPTVYFNYGTDGAKPGVTAIDNGKTYYATDTKNLYQVQAGAWVLIVKGGSLNYATNTYVGDNAANRAIDHGCGVTPKMIIIVAITGRVTAFYVPFAQAGNPGNTAYNAITQTAGTFQIIVGAANATNFIVNGQTNTNLDTFYWMAFY